MTWYKYSVYLNVAIIFIQTGKANVLLLSDNRQQRVSYTEELLQERLWSIDINAGDAAVAS